VGQKPSCLAFAPDGRLLVVTGGLTGVQFWEVSGERLSPLPGLAT